AASWPVGAPSPASSPSPLHADAAHRSPGNAPRSCAYTPARPASTSPRVRKKVPGVMVLFGTSSRFVHPWGSSSNVKTPTAPIHVVTRSLFMEPELLRTRDGGPPSPCGAVDS